MFLILAAGNLRVPRPVCAAHGDSKVFIPALGPCCVPGTSLCLDFFRGRARVVCIVDGCGHVT